MSGKSEVRKRRCGIWKIDGVQGEQAPICVCCVCSFATGIAFLCVVISVLNMLISVPLRISTSKHVQLSFILLNLVVRGHEVLFREVTDRDLVRADEDGVLRRTSKVALAVHAEGSA